MRDVCFVVVVVVVCVCVCVCFICVCLLMCFGCLSPGSFCGNGGHAASDMGTRHAALERHVRNTSDKKTNNNTTHGTKHMGQQTNKQKYVLVGAALEMGKPF